MKSGAYAMPERMNRGGLLARGAVLVASGGAAAALAAPAEAAIPDADLAYLRLLIGAELLKLDFYSRALGAKDPGASWQAVVSRGLLADKRHFNGLAALMHGAGQTPATPGDIDFSYPRGSFATRHATTTLGRRVSMLTLGAYLGALENVQTSELRLPLGQIAANEAQQAGVFGQLLGGHVVGSAFAPALQMDDVSAALDEYES
jgi:Ferritin-like domain